MAEVGNMPIPAGSSKGVRDMVRISDARMSGPLGPVVLHVAQKPMPAGPLAIVRTATGSVWTP